jgi:CBS domain containing-hemolysin-like protein
MMIATHTTLVLLASDVVAGENIGNPILFAVLVVPLLVLLNAFFVAAEFALVAVRRTRIQTLVAHGVRGAKSVDQALNNLNRAVAATQLGITIASLALGWLGESAIARCLTQLALWWTGPGLDAETTWWLAHSVAGPIALVMITFMHVVFGELIPKTIALEQPDTVALAVAMPLNLFTQLVSPFLRLMNGTANALCRAMGLTGKGDHASLHSVEELLLLVQDTEEAGFIAPDQADYLENVFRLTSKRVGDIMIARETIAALEVSTPPGQILETVRSGAHTRLPVYEGTIDNIIGIVNTKDLFYVFSLNGIVILQDALYPTLFLEVDMPVTAALRRFKQTHRHMGIVRDAEGKTVGLLTLEDVLEEIVGDIEDEHDRPSQARLPIQPFPMSAIKKLQPPAGPTKS